MVTFPRPIPDVRYIKGLPKLQRFTSQSQSGGRLTNVIEYADPVWTVTLVTRPLRSSDFRRVEAWWHSLREGLRTVDFRSPLYCTPRGNIRSRGPETTVGAIASITDRNVVAISGLVSGLVLSEGDLVSFDQSGRRALGQIVAASGSGTTRTIEIEPPLPISITVGANVRFDRASLFMRPVAKSFDPADGGVEMGPASFQLVESST